MKPPQYTTFTRSEVWSITGIDTVTQRDWQRRKLLPPREAGRGRYSLSELGCFMALRVLIDHKIPIGDAAGIAKASREAISEWAVIAWLKSTKQDEKPDLSPAGRYVVVSRDETGSQKVALLSDLAEILELRPVSAIIIDLAHLGALIAERSNKPLRIEDADLPALMSETEAAKAIGLPVKTFRAWVKSGRFPKAVPGTDLYDIKAIDAILDRLSGLSTTANALDPRRGTRKD